MKRRIRPAMRKPRPMPSCYAADRELVHEALAALPPEYREVIVLREFEELSYKQISAVVSIPLGTVMSRLDRAARAQTYLASRLREES